MVGAVGCAYGRGGRCAYSRGGVDTGAVVIALAVVVKGDIESVWSTWQSPG